MKLITIVMIALAMTLQAWGNYYILNKNLERIHNHLHKISEHLGIEK